MKLHFKPITLLGKWSVGLILVFAVFLALFYILVASGQRGGETFFSNLILTIPILIAGISGISAFATGLIGVIMSRERSIAVYISIIIGLLVLLFVLGEIIFPH